MTVVAETCQLIRKHVAKVTDRSAEAYFGLDETSLEEAVADYAEDYDDDPDIPFSAEKIAKSFIRDYAEL